jgi:SAM-dependent methyltransferase
MYLKNYSVQLVKDIIIRFPKRIILFFKYLSERSKLKGKDDKRFSLKLKDLYPCLKDRVTTTPFDHHYTYHPAWAARVLAQIKPKEHIDISSIISFSTIVSAFIPVRFYDYRPAILNLSNLKSDFADLKALPFENNSIHSLSCMHTIEHIGLGRYGDELDIAGDLKAIEELKRVVKQGGNLLFVTPVGKPRIEFNAHRIYSYEQIIEYFHPLALKEFSLIPDNGGLIENADPSLVNKQTYGCGCFWFVKQVYV